MSCASIEKTRSAPGAALSAAEEEVARSVVATHRARLDWLLCVPEWEELLGQGMEALEFPGRRQGIGLRAAMQTLALENKHELIRWTLEHFQNHLRAATARGVSRRCGIERFDQREVDEFLNQRQWLRFREQVLFRLAKEHRRYKHAQQLLFTGYRHLVARVVDQIVFRPAHRADCEQEGCMALLQAIDHVDVSGQNLASYSTAWIKRAVRNYLMRQRLPVYAPVNLISQAVTSASAGHAERSPAADSEDEWKLRILLLECLQHPAVSFDDAVAQDEAEVRSRMVDEAAETPADSAARTDLRDLVRSLLQSLTDKQRQVLVHRFGIGGGKASSLSEIARLTGISHQQVSMREQRALRRLESILGPLVPELSGAF